MQRSVRVRGAQARAECGRLHDLLGSIAPPHILCDRVLLLKIRPSIRGVTGNESVIMAFAPYLLRAAVALLVLATAEAQVMAATVVYSGGDAGAGWTAPHPNADAKAAAFDLAAGALGSVVTFTFEGLATGYPASIDLGAGATILGPSNELRNTSNSPAFSSVFGYNTTVGGSNFLEPYGYSPLIVNFAAPVTAFGLYITGVQTTYGSIVLTHGSNETIAIPMLSSQGGAQFLGFVVSGNPVTSLAISVQSGSSSDSIGIDDLRFVVAVPEPGSQSLALLGTALVLAAAARVRRRAA
jgi:hypothetical protein